MYIGIAKNPKMNSLANVSIPNVNEMNLPNVSALVTNLLY